MYEVSPTRADDLQRQFPDWRYVKEILQACTRDGGTSREENGAALSRVYCERDGHPYWEYVESYEDIQPSYKGCVLNRDYTVLYRALAVAPFSD